MISAQRHAIRRIWRTAPGTLFAVVSAIAVTLTACSTGATSAERAAAGGAVVNWEQPLRDAKVTTLRAARVLTGLAIPTPRLGTTIWAVPQGAKRMSIRLFLSKVWISPRREVALVFNDGALTMLVGRATSTDPVKVFRRDLAAIRVGRASIGTVDGQPAFIAQPRTDYQKSNPALVEFYLDRVDLYVISMRLPISLVIGVADTVRIPVAPGAK